MTSAATASFILLRCFARAFPVRAFFCLFFDRVSIYDQEQKTAPGKKAAVCCGG